MSRYIEVDKLTEHKFSYVSFDRYVSDGKPKSEKEIYAYKVGYNDAIDRIVRFAPTADVRENVHAKWVKVGQSFLNPNRFRCYACSECGFSIDYIPFRFCPNCGAQMDEAIVNEITKDEGE